MLYFVNHTNKFLPLTESQGREPNLQEQGPTVGLLKESLRTVIDITAVSFSGFLSMSLLPVLLCLNFLIFNDVVHDTRMVFCEQFFSAVALQRWHVTT